MHLPQCRKSHQICNFASLLQWKVPSLHPYVLSMHKKWKNKYKIRLPKANNNTMNNYTDQIRKRNFILQPLHMQMITLNTWPRGLRLRAKHNAWALMIFKYKELYTVAVPLKIIRNLNAQINSLPITLQIKIQF